MLIASQTVVPLKLPLMRQALAAVVQVTNHPVWAWIRLILEVVIWCNNNNNKKNASSLQRYGITFLVEAFATRYLADNQGPISNAAVRGCVPGS